jgi:hypothetical protein
VEKSLTILYTGGLRGDLALLPRLFTFIRRLKAQESGRVLLIDAGDACDPAVWHCAVTGGRSMLIALDGMGYDAAYLPLTDEDRARLDDSVRIAAVDAAHPAHVDEVTLSAEPDPNAVLTVLLPMGVKTILEEGILKLEKVSAGEVRRLRLTADAASPIRLTSEALPMPVETPPDPTIAGVIDFIEREADYARRRKLRRD